MRTHNEAIDRRAGAITDHDQRNGQPGYLKQAARNRARLAELDKSPLGSIEAQLREALLNAQR